MAGRTNLEAEVQEFLVATADLCNKDEECFNIIQRDPKQDLCLSVCTREKTFHRKLKVLSAEKHAGK